MTKELIANSCVGAQGTLSCSEQMSQTFTQTTVQLCRDWRDILWIQAIKVVNTFLTAEITLRVSLQLPEIKKIENQNQCLKRCLPSIRNI